jgi:hypothetical protein
MELISARFEDYTFDFFELLSLFSQSDLAELCAECEKYIGTQGGKFN